MPRGVNGHPAARHVVMETEPVFDLVLHIAMMLNQVIYRALKLVMLAIVISSLRRFQQRE